MWADTHCTNLSGPEVHTVLSWITKCNFSMNQELIYHQKKQQGKMIIAEFLINDFRFWCDVEEGFLIDA